MFEFTDHSIFQDQDFSFEAWFNQIIEQAFLPNSDNQPLPADDQGIAYV